MAVKEKEAALEELLASVAWESAFFVFLVVFFFYRANLKNWTQQQYMEGFSLLAEARNSSRICHGMAFKGDLKNFNGVAAFSRFLSIWSLTHCCIYWICISYWFRFCFLLL